MSPSTQRYAVFGCAVDSTSYVVEEKVTAVAATVILVTASETTRYILSLLLSIPPDISIDTTNRGQRCLDTPIGEAFAQREQEGKPKHPSLHLQRFPNAPRGCLLESLDLVASVIVLVLGYC